MKKSLFDCEWERFLIKAQRKYGGKLWQLQTPVAIFINGKFVGGHMALIKFLLKRFRIQLYEYNLEEMVMCATLNAYEKLTSEGRSLAYISLKTELKYCGTMIFQLYNDLLPLTCQLFLKHCYAKGNCGYVGTYVHRIVQDCWIQIGGLRKTSSSHACENYIVPHDRRGILSMCNDGMNKNNDFQFFITLEATPWMNSKYVAFGQLIQGAHVLNQIEQIETYYEHPKELLFIHNAGEFLIQSDDDGRPKLIKSKDVEATATGTNLHRKLSIHANFSEASILSNVRYADGKYYFGYDTYSHLPLNNLREDLHDAHTVAKSEQILTSPEFHAEFVRDSLTKKEIKTVNDLMNIDDEGDEYKDDQKESEGDQVNELVINESQKDEDDAIKNIKKIIHEDFLKFLSDGSDTSF